MTTKQHIQTHDEATAIATEFQPTRTTMTTVKNTDATVLVAPENTSDLQALYNQLATDASDPNRAWTIGTD